MGKNRKNRRNFDSDEEDTPNIIENLPAPVQSSNKKKNKNLPKFLPPEDDETTEDIKDNWEDETESSSQPPPAKAKVNAFALLGGDDDSDTAEDVSSKLEQLDVNAEPVEAAVVDPFAEDDSEEDSRKKKKKGKKGKQQNENQVEVVEAQPGGGTVKTKAQKAAEKKERDKKKRELAKAKKKEEDNEFAAALAEAGVVLADDYTQDEKKGKKKKKKKEAKQESAEDLADDVPVPEVKVEATGATSEKTEQPAPEQGDPDNEAPGDEAPGDDAPDGENEEEIDTKKKRRKKKKPGERQTKPTAHAKRLKEALDQLAAEKERLAKEAEEAEREAERQEQERLEKIRLEEERKQRKKEKEKERKERRKKEGTWLSKAERDKRDRAQAALEAMRQQGIIVPGQVDAPAAEKPAGKVRYASRQRKKKPQQPQKEDQIAEAMESADRIESEKSDKGGEKEGKEVPSDSWELLDTPKDATAENWDYSGDEKSRQTDEVVVDKEDLLSEPGVEEEEEEDETESESEEEEETESESESEEDDEEDDDELPPLQRIQARAERAERTKDPNVLRAPILCVLGHVDTGKTTILDKLRRTNVQEGEAGGITQQIGATNVPIDNILKECSHLSMPDMKIPGMLIIDTPGHESFSNLRSRGSSLCDMAVLVVDIMHGLEQQTIESLNLLKKRRTPFVIALNKIDRLYEWKTSSKTPVADVLKSQKKITRDDFEDRSKKTMLQIAEQGMNAKLFYENPDPRTYISIVPVSGWSGDGMADLLKLVCELSQKMLGPQLIFKDVLEAMVLEVKAIHGLGTTVDIILKNGQIKEGDNIVLSGIDGAFSTTIRAVLTPHPMKEMRVKNNYIQHKVVKAAQGIKICARDMDKTLAGMPVYVAKRTDEAEVLMEEANRALKEELKSIKLSSEGVYVQASTLGSLEALLEFLKESKIKYSGVSIGPVHKKDVMKASVMLQHDKEFACLLAFDVKVERDAQETADSLGVRIFTADIIYHLFDQFMAYKDELKLRRKEENRHLAVFPCRLRVIPTCIFNTRDPIVLGVTVINGILKPGTPLCVPSKEFVYIGVVTSLEMNNKALEIAHCGQDVCIKIENIGGDAPKLYGRHFDENDVLVSKITRDSIDCLKEYFRDDMSKGDWKLIVELKKLFNIL